MLITLKPNVSAVRYFRAELSSPTLQVEDAGWLKLSLPLECPFWPFWPFILLILLRLGFYSLQTTNKNQPNFKQKSRQCVPLGQTNFKPMQFSGSATQLECCGKPGTTFFFGFFLYGHQRPRGSRVCSCLPVPQLPLSVSFLSLLDWTQIQIVHKWNK